VRSFSVPSNFVSPEGHPVSVYVFFLVFPSLLSSIVPLATCFRRHFIRYLWPTKLALLLFFYNRTFLSSLTLRNTPLLTRPIWQSTAFSSSTFFRGSNSHLSLF
jgi:hypothetical protein